MQKEKESLYEYIYKNMENGELSEDFSLPKETNSDAIQFADGAIDGIMMFHMGMSPIKPEESKELLDILNSVNRNNTETAKEKLQIFSEKKSALSVIDEFQKIIVDNAQQLNAETMYEFARDLILNSDNCELVKYGMSIIELLNIKEEELKKVIRVLALSDEFTLFAIFIMRNWENPEQEIFEIAKKVKGWGRIHAIERINPTNKEMEEWLLLHGIENNVMAAYSALEIYEKAKIKERLFSKKCLCSFEEYIAIGNVIAALFQEGPVMGISMVEEVDKLLNQYVELFNNYEWDIKGLQIIYNIEQYTEENKEPEIETKSGFKEIVRKCRDILYSEKSVEIVAAETKKGNSLELADFLNIDYKEDLWELFETDLNQYFGYTGILIREEAYRDRVIDLFEQSLPLKIIASGPAECMGFGKEYENHRILNFCVQELGEWPGKGIPLLKTALFSSVISNRNLALSVIEKWEDSTKLKIKDISEELWQVLMQLKTLECDEKVLERVNNCLDASKKKNKS